MKPLTRLNMSIWHRWLTNGSWGRRELQKSADLSDDECAALEQLETNIKSLGWKESEAWRLPYPTTRNTIDLLLTGLTLSEHISTERFIKNLPLPTIDMIDLIQPIDKAGESLRKCSDIDAIDLSKPLHRKDVQSIANKLDLPYDRVKNYILGKRRRSAIRVEKPVTRSSGDNDSQAKATNDSERTAIIRNLLIDGGYINNKLTGEVADNIISEVEKQGHHIQKSVLYMVVWQIRKRAGIRIRPHKERA